MPVTNSRQPSGAAPEVPPPPQTSCWSQVMLYLHDRDVKGYVVLNVLVFDEELQRMEQRVRQVAEAGVDAVIVQVGLCGPCGCFCWPASRSHHCHSMVPAHACMPWWRAVRSGHGLYLPLPMLCPPRHTHHSCCLTPFHRMLAW